MPADNVEAQTFYFHDEGKIAYFVDKILDADTGLEVTSRVANAMIIHTQVQDRGNPAGTMNVREISDFKKQFTPLSELI